MFKIGKEFHLLHVVSDLNAADEWYDRIFSVRRFVRNYMKAAMRKASLVLIGDFVMEPAQPVQIARLGEIGARQILRAIRPAFSFHRLVCRRSARKPRLNSAGIRFACSTWSESRSPRPTRGDAVWTHPQDTHAAFEFAVAPKFFIDPRLQPGWSIEFPRDQHPLGIERASHMTVLFRNLDDARGVYEEALGGKLIHQEDSRKAQHVFRGR